ncbi:MAG: hypothetical protein EA425_02170 [Puniceicoccaceae bacterium]|nr:MAG: hypothetical protein EA425_02170 [Puniceicoccaceae bacterium]
MPIPRALLPPPRSIPQGDAIPRSERQRLRGRLHRSIADLGIAYTSESGGDSHSAIRWMPDPLPLVLEPETWTHLAEGVAQRARLVNALLADSYRERQALLTGSIPPATILGDPFYRRPCYQLLSARATPATVVRIDVTRDAEGTWRVLDTFANTPFGIAFAVQNRRLLGQEAPWIFEQQDIHPGLIDYPLRLLDRLQGLCPRNSGNPNLVVLSAGPRDPAFFEHSFLARKMGLSLATGEDLLVLDNQVYFKTIGGLKRIDVLYRRISDTHIDPAVFSTPMPDRGVPGLLGCIRAGTVAVANAPGAGLAENRAFEACLNRLLRFYLGQRPILPGFPTYHCADIDQLEFALGEADRMTFRPLHHEWERFPAAGPGDPARQRERTLRAVQREPSRYVAQAITTPPEESEALRLSCFALCQGEDVEVIPGALVRRLQPRRLGLAGPWQIGHTTDLLLLNGKAAPRGAPSLRPPARLHPLDLGSRAAESLFWCGRYLERTEASSRMLGILEDIGLEEFGMRERLAWLPVWRAILEATGHKQEKGGRIPEAGFTAENAWRFVLDPANASSLFASLSAATANARRLRDYFSPEALGILTHLHDDLASLARRRRRASKAVISSALSRLNSGLAAFFGTAERTMLQDDGWHFYSIGIHLERAIMTAGGLRHVLREAERAARYQRREEADLSAFLRMLSSQDAYRRIYQARAEPLFVAELFLLHSRAPKSIRFSLLSVLNSLESLQPGGSGERPTVAFARSVLGFLENLNLEGTFKQRTDSPRPAPAVSPAPGPRARDPGLISPLVRTLADQLGTLGDLIHDYYFSHQARLGRGTQQEFII